MPKRDKRVKCAVYEQFGRALRHKERCRNNGFLKMGKDSTGGGTLRMRERYGKEMTKETKGRVLDGFRCVRRDSYSLGDFFMTCRALIVGARQRRSAYRNPLDPDLQH